MSYRVIVLNYSKGKADKKRMSYLSLCLFDLGNITFSVREFMTLFNAVSELVEDFQSQFPGPELEVRVKEGKNIEDSSFVIIEKGKRLVEANVLFNICFTKRSLKLAMEDFKYTAKQGLTRAIEEKEMDGFIDYYGEKGGEA